MHDHDSSVNQTNRALRQHSILLSIQLNFLALLDFSMLCSILHRLVFGILMLMRLVSRCSVMLVMRMTMLLMGMGMIMSIRLCFIASVLMLVLLMLMLLAVLPCLIYCLIGLISISCIVSRCFKVR